MDQSIVSQRVKPADAAKEIGCCVPFLYEMMRIGKWDLGDYTKPKGRKKATVFIFRDKLDKFLGKEPPPCEEQETSQPQQA